jgi:membrane-bound lytic murein transglycosylase D
MAGYNAGEAKVDKALKVHSADDFWSLAAASKSKEPVATKRSKSKKKSTLVNHTVKSGETLSSIAAKYGVPTSAILSRNHLSSHRQIKVGQHLQIQTPTKSTPSQPGIRAETRNYVPQIIAAALIASDPARYGFGEVELQPAMAFDTVTVPFSVDLRGLAKEVGATFEVLKDLNPELLHPLTPQDGRLYELRLPQGSSKNFLARLESLKAGPVTTYLSHTLAPGESPASVARKYKISVNALLAANDLNHKDLKKLKPGLTLKVPSRSAVAKAEPEPSSLASAKRRPSLDRSESKPREASSKASGALTHVVKAGENPWSIARRYHLTTAKLLAHNNCDEHLKIGQVLEIPGTAGPAKGDKAEPAAATAAAKGQAQPQSLHIHVVKSGENLQAISRLYNVSQAQLISWNHLAEGRKLRVGQVLAVYVDRDGAS